VILQESRKAVAQADRVLQQRQYMLKGRLLREENEDYRAKIQRDMTTLSALRVSLAVALDDEVDNLTPAPPRRKEGKSG